MQVRPGSAQDSAQDESGNETLTATRLQLNCSDWASEEIAGQIRGLQDPCKSTGERIIYDG